MKKKSIICLVLVALAIAFYKEQISDTFHYVVAKLKEEQSQEIDWAKLKASNADIYAWINVPGTPIDYPVMQSATDNSYYLTHDRYQEENIYGAIYTENINSQNFSDPMTVVYGHNMRDDSMFGSLKNFTDKAFFEENDKIFVSIDTGEELTYQIVAAYKYPAEHILSTFDFTTSEKATEYFEEVPEFVKKYRGNYKEEPILKSPVITLSTCTANQENYRYLVQGVLIERKGENDG